MPIWVAVNEPTPPATVRGVVTYHQHNTPRPPPTGPVRSSGSPVWWVLAAVAAVVSVALALWLVVSSPPGPVPTTPAPSTPAVSTPSAEEPTTPPSTPAPPTEEWGDFPPTNLDDLKDLSEANFPQTVGSFTFEGENRTSFSVMADYGDNNEPRTMGVVLDFVGFNKGDYKAMVGRWEHVSYHGRAVCGFAAESRTIPSCVMVGTSEMLDVGTADEDTTLEEVAVFTEALYDSL